jgi:hypothetical protein
MRSCAADARLYYVPAAEYETSLEAPMVKLVYVVRRRADFSPEAFRKRWLVHGPLVRELASAIRACRYVQSHTIDTPLNDALAQTRGMAPAYDGITEVWFHSLEELMAGAGSAEGHDAALRLLEDEREFIDLAGSSLFLTEEHVIFGDAP